MRMLAFARRNAKEILRDPLTLFFGLVFPLILLGLLSLIARHAPVDMFRIDSLAPGIAAFGYSFLALFSALLIAKDRSSSLMMRLLTSPLRARDYIPGYALPLIPMAVLQSGVCLLAALPLGLKAGWNLLLCIAVLLPAALIYIALGLICGSLLNDKQVGGVCGALLTNLTAWLSGIWFDIELLGGGFSKIARMLPFANAVDAARMALAGDMAGMAAPLLMVIAYAAVLSLLAVGIFARRMRRA